MNNPLKFPARPEVIIFDCDGVLFDSRKANQSFYNHLLEHFGKPPMTEADLSYVHMHTAGESITYLFGDNHLRDAVLRLFPNPGLYPFYPADGNGTGID